jgi:hypothetical protein
MEALKDKQRVRKGNGLINKTMQKMLLYIFFLLSFAYKAYLFYRHQIPIKTQSFQPKLAQQLHTRNFCTVLVIPISPST